MMKILMKSENFILWLHDGFFVMKCPGREGMPEEVRGVPSYPGRFRPSSGPIAKESAPAV